MLPTHQIRAQIESSVNEEERTVDLVWTTGAKGLRWGWDGKYYEELAVDDVSVDMSRLREGAPLLAAHNDMGLDGVIGVVERAWIQDGKGMAKVRFARDADSDAIFQKVKDKILRNVSVGYSVQEYKKVSNPDDEVPTYRATRWQPAELSIVPIGFDNGAKTRNKENVNESEVEIIERSDESTTEVEELSRSLPNKELTIMLTPEEIKAQAEKQAQEAVLAERTRSTEIRKMVKDANLSDTLAEDFIQRGLKTDEAKKNVEAMQRAIEESKKTEVAATVRIEVGTTDTEKKRDAIVETLLHRIDPVNFQVKQGNPYVGYNLLRSMEGLVNRPTGQYEAEYSKRVMSSSDLPYILSNIAEKSAQKKYQLQPRTWSRWASTGTLKNFKTHDSVRSGDFASLLERQENGEFKEASFSEEREQVTMKEWGRTLQFTRRMLLNDDLGEIAKVAAQSGVAASRLENRLVYEVLTSNPDMGDGTDLFHANHSNLAASGNAAALSDTTIGYAFESMRGQTSVDGADKLNLVPQYLICGPSNEVLARKYLSVISPTQASNVNVFSSSLELIVDAEISTNDYFFSANPSLIETVKLFHLEGEEQPRVESRTKFETEAFELKVAHSCVAKAMDWRGLHKNPNAS